MMLDLNPSRKLAVRRRAGYFHVLSLLPALERQWLFLCGWLLLATTAAVQAQFTFTTNNGTITITGHAGTDRAVDIPSTITDLPVTTIGDFTFDGDINLASVTIPNTVTIIGMNAFESCSLTNVIIPNSVTTIGWNAFNSCTSLTNVTIPNSVTGLGRHAFEGCTNLTIVTIPNSVTDIGYGAFDYDTSLTAINLEPANPAYSSANGVLFNRSQTRLIQYPGGKVGSYSIPTSVTSIEGGAFSLCLSLVNVTIPNSVASIGDYAFAGCTSLKRAFFQGNAPSGDSSVFSSDTNATAYYLPGTTGWGSTFGGIPTELWSLPYPLILNSSLGVRSNQFGFTVSWATNLSVVVEASTDLRNPAWTPLATNALTGGSFYFADPHWTNYSKHFYRVRSQ